MSEPITFVIFGDPQAQKRHRHYQMKKAGGAGVQVRTYDPGAADKGDFLSIIQQNRPNVPWDGPLRVDINFFFARPKAHYRTGANSHLLRDNAPKWHISKPDRDNLDKFVLDAMKGIFFRDDSQVCSGSPKKMYDAVPRTEVRIMKLT